MHMASAVAALSSMNQHSVCVTFYLRYDTSVLPEYERLGSVGANQDRTNTLVIPRRFGWM